MSIRPSRRGFERDFEQEFEDEARRHRRVSRAMGCLWLSLVVVLAWAGVFAATHPEVIGEFIGRIVAGARQAQHG